MTMMKLLAPFFVAVAVLLTMAYMTYFERRIIGWMQFRQGPNRVGPLGLLQPIVDALKLIAKQRLIPNQSFVFFYTLAPLLSFFTSLFVWSFLPIGLDGSCIETDLSLVWAFATTSLGVYGILLAGWSSNSKYALLGAIRSVAQVLSYELVLSLIFLSLILSYSTFSLSVISHAQSYGIFSWTAFRYPHLFILYLIGGFAETNRNPFDIAEGESELVAGYHVEYGGWSFALFFLAEYINMIIVSVLAALLFLGGTFAPWSSASMQGSILWIIMKTAGILFLYIWVRATLPRYRYDQLMHLSWFVLIPFATLNVILLAVLHFFYPT